MCSTSGKVRTLYLRSSLSPHSRHRVCLATCGVGLGVPCVHYTGHSGSLPRRWTSQVPTRASPPSKRDTMPLPCQSTSNHLNRSITTAPPTSIMVPPPSPSYQQLPRLRTTRGLIPLRIGSGAFIYVFGAPDGADNPLTEHDVKVMCSHQYLTSTTRASLLTCPPVLLPPGLPLGHSFSLHLYGTAPRVVQRPSHAARFKAAN